MKKGIRIALAWAAMAALMVLAGSAATRLSALQAPRKAAAGRPPDPATLTALLKAKAGTYLAVDGSLEPAPKDDEVPLMLQADAHRRPPARVAVPLAITSAVKQAWTMRVQVSGPGEGARLPLVSSDSLAGAPGDVHEVRDLTLAPGSYEVVVVLARYLEGRRWVATVARHPLAVPDVWAPQLTVTPVVLAQKSADARPEDRDKPFIFGPVAVTTAASNRFTRDETLQTAFRIYGWQADADAKPDLMVSYTFNQRVGRTLRPLNPTKPQPLNAQTLAREFDGKSGEALGGIRVPLANFPVGEFELRVRVTDQRTNATASQGIRFFVGGQTGV